MVAEIARSIQPKCSALTRKASLPQRQYQKEVRVNTSKTRSGSGAARGNVEETAWHSGRAARRNSKQRQRETGSEQKTEKKGGRENKGENATPR